MTPIRIPCRVLKTLVHICLLSPPILQVGFRVGGRRVQGASLGFGIGGVGVWSLGLLGLRV